MSVLETLRCTPTRRSIKFVAGPHARHFLVFDGAIDKESRLLLFVHIFAFQRALVDAAVLPAYDVAMYLPEELVEVRVVADARHPAYGQAGLYAKRAIPTGTIVTPYAGFIEIFSASCSSRTYTMGFGAVNDDVALDAEFAGNYGRFANDPRGVDGLGANLSAESRVNARGESFTALIARRQIAEGEEILMAYGKAHSLSPAPWLSAQGRPLLRARRAGELPLPCVSPSRQTATTTTTTTTTENADDNGVGDARTHTTAADVTAASSELLWECTQCGAWNATPCATGTTALDTCCGCQTPRLGGARLVHVLSSPPLTRAQLQREAQPCRAALDVDACLDRLYTRRRDNNNNNNNNDDNDKGGDGRRGSRNGGAVKREDDDSNNNNNDSTQAHKPPSSPRRLTPAAPRRRRNWESNLQLAPSSTSTVGCVVSSYRLDAVRCVPAPSTTTATLATNMTSSTTSTMTTAVSDTRSGSATTTTTTTTPTTTTTTPLSSLYHSVRIDWPLHVPFLPWQVWDPVVPYTALAKHSRFDTHEHVFLYHVQPPSSHHDDDNDDDDNDDTTSDRSHSDGDGDEGSSNHHNSNDDEAKENKRDDGDDTAGARRRARRPHAAAQRQRQRPRRQPSQPLPPRRRTRSGGLWQRQDEHEEAVSCARAHVDAAAMASDAHTRNDDDQCNARCVCGHRNSACQHDNNNNCCCCCDCTRVAACTSASLCRALAGVHEVDRLIVLPRERTARNDHGGHRCSGHDDACACAGDVIELVRRTLARMTRRVFAGKSFQAGDVVAYVGGVVRRVHDRRCRPDASPLALPMRLLAPSAWRRCLRRVTRSRGTGGCSSNNSDGDDDEAAAASLLRDNASDFVARLAALELVVTNEMMYCPCLAMCDDDDSDDDDGGSDGYNDDKQQRQHHERASCTTTTRRTGATPHALLMQTCNVALVLTMDALGSPHVVAVATRPIAAFEALLARTQ